MKNLLLAIFAMLIMASCSNTEQYVIKGTLEGATDEVVLLQKRSGSQMEKVDSVVVNNGEFEFAPGSVDYPQMYYIAVEGKRGTLGFFIENSAITVTGHVDTIYDARVDGSASHTEYVAYNDLIAPYYEKNSELYEEYRAAMEAGDEAVAEEINSKRETLFDELGEFQAKYVEEHPASFVTPVILRSISYQMDAAELENAVNALDESLAVSDIVISLKERVEALKAVAIGVVAPDFTQNDPDGNPVTLSELEGHKLLLVDFWAAWCGPCRRENPNVVAVYNEFHEMGFDVLGVSLDSDRDDWLQAIADDNLTWKHVSDLKYWDNEVAKLYAVNSIPANFLLDAEGKIIATGLRGDDLRAKIAELLSE